jgi:hypothetical protein
MPTVVEGSQEECVDAVNGGLCICLPMEGDVLAGSCANYDHKDGEEAGVGGAHGVGVEADVGGGGQQICVAEVTCVEW